jgi:hypothetical protein
MGYAKRAFSSCVRAAMRYGIGIRDTIITGMYEWVGRHGILFLCKSPVFSPAEIEADAGYTCGRKKWMIPFSHPTLSVISVL